MVGISCLLLNGIDSFHNLNGNLNRNVLRIGLVLIFAFSLVECTQEKMINDGVRTLTNQHFLLFLLITRDSFL